MKSGYMKKAIRRRDGFEPGHPAPLYLVCICGAEVDIDREAYLSDGPTTDKTAGECARCGTTYDARGWILKNGNSGTSENPIRYERVTAGDPDRAAKLKAQREKFEQDAKAGKVLCLSDLMISHGM